MKKLKYSFFILFVFIAGGSVFLNLGGLIETNPTWEPAWWKVWLSLSFGALFSIYAYCEANNA